MQLNKINKSMGKLASLNDLSKERIAAESNLHTQKEASYIWVNFGDGSLLSFPKGHFHPLEFIFG